MKKASTGKIDFDKLDIDKVDRERRRQAIEKNKISNGEIDLLDSIKGYQDEKIIQHLRANGIDGLQVRNILRNNFGFIYYNNSPVLYKQKEKKNDRKINYAIRNISALCKSSLLKKSEISTIHKIELRLQNESFRLSRDTILEIRWLDRNKRKGTVLLGSSRDPEIVSIGTRQKNDTFKIKMKNGEAFLDCRCDMSSPKSYLQLIGVQMAELFDYIKKFNHGKFINKEIFGLIATLFKKLKNEEFDTDQIKKLIENNKKFIKIKSSIKITKSKKVITSKKS